MQATAFWGQGLALLQTFLVLGQQVARPAFSQMSTGIRVV